MISRKAWDILRRASSFSDEAQAEEYIAASGKFTDAILLSGVFWPEFTVFQEHVFLADFTKGNSFDIAQKECSLRSDVEAFVNHRHIMDLFGNPCSEASAEEISYLGNLLSETWKAKLKAEFGNRKFEVRFCDDKEDMAGSYITFWQTNDGLK